MPLLMRNPKEIMEEIGILEKEETVPEELNQENIIKLLNSKGLTVTKALDSLRDLINSDKDEIKKAATETLLKLHKVINNDKVEVNDKIVFQLNGSLDLIGIISPTRKDNIEETKETIQ